MRKIKNNTARILFWIYFIFIITMVLLIVLNKQFILKSSVVIINETPIVTISGYNGTISTCYFTVTGVEYKDKYSCNSPIYSMKRWSYFGYKYIPSMRTDDCIYTKDCSYTIHIYKRKDDELVELCSKTFSEDSIEWRITL